MEGLTSTTQEGKLRSMVDTVGGGCEVNWVQLLQGLLENLLTLNAPITTKVVCFSRVLNV